MTNYGFRLFRVMIYRNNRTGPCKVKLSEDGVEQHFRDYLFDLATSRIGVVVHGAPQRHSDDNDDESGEDESVPARSRPVLVITDVSHRGDHVVVDYMYGRRLGYTHAGYAEPVGDPKPGEEPPPPVPIADLKSVRQYRAVFMFPEVGEAGVVAVEDASRACASKKLEQWLRAWARQDAEAETKKKQQETGKKSIRSPYWSMRFTPLSDPEKLEKLMKNGTSSKIVLTKQGASSSNTPGKAALKVEMGLDNATSTANARKLITKWMKLSNESSKALSESPKAQTEATRDLAAVLADRYEGFNVEDYDDAWIEVRDGDGKPKQISPSRWADTFIYPVTSGIECPKAALFYGRVQQAVTPLEKSLEVSIEWAGWGGDDG